MNTLIEDGIIVLELCHAYPRRLSGVLSAVVQPFPYQIVDCDDVRDVKCVELIGTHSDDEMLHYSRSASRSYLSAVVFNFVLNKCKWV
jgi:hypothetical protein